MTPTLSAAQAHDAAADLARRALEARRRVLLGLAGPPGAGKSTLAAGLVGHVLRTCGDGTAVVVPMDGFHLSTAELRRRGLSGRKGAPETFDADGFVGLVAQLAAGAAARAPAFDRHAEEPVPDAVEIPATAALVVVEGNYLLLDGPWTPLRGLLDVVWFLVPDDGRRVEALIARHVAHGRGDAAARAWVADVDEPNARLVAGTRGLADACVRPW